MSILTPILGKIDSNDTKNHNSWTINQSKEALTFRSLNSQLSLRRFSYPNLKNISDSNDFSFIIDFGSSNIAKFCLTNNEFIIESPITAELHLFYYLSNSALYFSDSFSALVKLISIDHKIELDYLGIQEYLCSDFNLTDKTIVKNIKLLPENQKLVYQNGLLQLSQLQTLTQQVVAFNQVLNETECLESLASVIDDSLVDVSRFAKNNQIASSLSGGVDSAILAHRSSLRGTDIFVSFLLPEWQRSSQKSTLAELKNCLAGNFLSDKIENIPLLSFDIPSNNLDPYIDPYGIFGEQIVKELMKKDVKVILSGLGADDLFYLPKSSKSELKTDTQNSQDRFLSFFNTPSTNSGYRKAERFSIVPPVLSQSILFYSGFWRNYGVWPVFPFVKRRAISLAGQLPIKFRSSKFLLREYVAKIMNCPIVAKAPRDTFKNYFQKSLFEFYQTNGEELLESSIIMRSGLINTKLLKKTVDIEVLSGKFSKEVSMLLYSLLRIELFFRSM